MSDLLRVIRTRRGLILRCAAAVIGLTAIVLFLLPTRYTATAVVMLDLRHNNVTASSQVLADIPTDAASLQNQIQILTSRDLAAEVIAKEKLYNDPEFNPALDDNPFAALGDLFHPSKWFSGGGPARSDRDAIIDSVLTHLSVNEQGLSTTFNVSFTTGDKEKSARIANAFVTAYVEDQVHSKYEAAQKTTQWLEKRVGQLAKQVQTAEAAVQDYKAKHNLNEGAEGVSLADQQMAAVNGQLVAARADLAQKEAVAQRVKDLVASGHAGDVSQAVDSPLIVALRGQEAALIQQEADLTARYGPKHPKMIAIEKQRTDLEAKISQEVDRIAGSLANDVAVAKANVASLEASLHSAERVAGKQNAAKVQLKALQANATSTRAMYESFVTRLRETQDQEAIQLPDARVISPAAVPIYPSSPKRTLMFAASIPAGLLIGLLMALVAERMGWQVQTVRRFVPVRARPPRPRAPVLAQMHDASAPRAADYVFDWPGSSFAQSLNTLMRDLATPTRGARPRVIGITSVMPDTAKPNIVMGLARVAARAGWRVVAVDGDLARANLGRAVGYERINGGLLDALSRKAPLSRSFVKDPRSNALMLCASQPVSNAAAVTGSPAMAQLLTHLRAHADLVIVDCPPVLGGSEARRLAQMADAMLVVIDPHRTTATAVDAAMASLGGTQAGLILAG